MVCGSLLQAVTLSDTMMVNRYVKWQFVNKKFQTDKESEQEPKWRHHSHRSKCRPVPPRLRHSCTCQYCPLSLVFRGSLSTREGSGHFRSLKQYLPMRCVISNTPKLYSFRSNSHSFLFAIASTADVSQATRPGILTRSQKPVVQPERHATVVKWEQEERNGRSRFGAVRRRCRPRQT
jgi:hypothetical protein